MTVGEKIQFYRKKLGLSQEELGQKLLVSRQTVSLWEMDKTLPTVDNLLRLKEIFSLSMDEILSDAEPIEQNREEPKEVYSFAYQKEDLEKITKMNQKPMILRALVFSLICGALLMLFSGAAMHHMITGLILGWFLCGLLMHIKNYRTFKKAWRAQEKRLLESEYTYEVYDRYFMLILSRNSEVKRTMKVYFEDVEKVETFGIYTLLQISGQLFLLKKKALREDSPLLALCNKPPKKIEAKNTDGFLKAASILLFVFSIVGIFGALLGVSVLSELNGVMEENMWVFFLFAPIPIASILFGFYLKKKGYKYKMNMIVGFIMALLLCIYGSFSFIFADHYSHSDEPIKEAEELLSIDIPAHKRINTHDLTKGSQSFRRGYIYYTSDIYFEEGAVEAFERDLPNDPKWIAELPNDLIGITADYSDFAMYDYYIVYNKDTGEFNKLPSVQGKYQFINVLYDKDDNTMKLVEYELEYTK